MQKSSSLLDIDLRSNHSIETNGNFNRVTSKSSVCFSGGSNHEFPDVLLLNRIASPFIFILTIASEITFLKPDKVFYIDLLSQLNDGKSMQVAMYS